MERLQTEVQIPETQNCRWGNLCINVFLEFFFFFFFFFTARQFFCRLICICLPCTLQLLPSRRGGEESWPGGGPSAGDRLLTLFAGADHTVNRPADGAIHSLCVYNNVCRFCKALLFSPFYCLILRFIKGFIYRHKERCPENEYFLDYVRYSFLMTLRRNLPKNVLDKSWPTPPAALTEVGLKTDDQVQT